MRAPLVLAAVVAVTIAAPITQAHAWYECKAVAKSLLGNGPKLGGTFATGEGETRRDACWAARERCEWRLDRKRDRDGFGYPLAKCERVGYAKEIWD